KSSDPDGYAVIHDGLVYPVRGGVFLIGADQRADFPSFDEAGEVPAHVSADLADLGCWPQDGQVEEPPATEETDEDDDDDEQEEPTLADLIEAVASHDDANALAEKLGVEGFKEKKPGVEAKKAALREKAAELAALEETDEDDDDDEDGEDEPEVGDQQ